MESETTSNYAVRVLGSIATADASGSRDLVEGRRQMLALLVAVGPRGLSFDSLADEQPVLYQSAIALAARSSSLLWPIKTRHDARHTLPDADAECTKLVEGTELAPFMSGAGSE